MSFYAQSNNIKVYPTAFRKQVTIDGVSTSFNPEATLNLEKNITELTTRISSKSKDSYVVSYAEGSNIIFIIHGYWFKVDNLSAAWSSHDTTKELWAAIELANTSSQVSGSTIDNPILTSYGSQGQILDNLDSASGSFYGVTFFDEEPTVDNLSSFKLQLLNANQEVPATSYLNLSTRQIQNGNSVVPITEEFTSKVLDGVEEIKSDSSIDISASSINILNDEESGSVISFDNDGSANISGEITTTKVIMRDPESPTEDSIVLDGPESRISTTYIDSVDATVQNSLTVGDIDEGGPLTVLGPAGDIDCDEVTAKYTITSPTFAGNYGVCSTAANVAAKTVSIPNFQFVEGAHFFVVFANQNTATGDTTLSINGSEAHYMVQVGYGKDPEDGTEHVMWGTLRKIYPGTVYEFVYPGDNTGVPSFYCLTPRDVVRADKAVTTSFTNNDWKLVTHDEFKGYTVFSLGGGNFVLVAVKVLGGTENGTVDCGLYMREGPLVYQRNFHKGIPFMLDGTMYQFVNMPISYGTGWVLYNITNNSYYYEPQDGDLGYRLYYKLID